MDKIVATLVAAAERAEALAEAGALRPARTLVNIAAEVARDLEDGEGRRAALRRLRDADEFVACVEGALVAA